MTDQAIYPDREDGRVRLDRLKNNERLVFALIGQDTTLKPSGREKYSGPCPFHSGDNPNGFILSHRAGYWRWHCITGNCGGGSIIDYIQQREGLNTVWEAAAWIENWDGVAPPVVHTRTYQKPPPEPATLAKAAWEYSAQVDQVVPGLETTGRDWWHAKGLSDRAIARFWLGMAPSFTIRRKGELLDAATASIPIWENNQVVSLRHRIITPDTGGDKYRPHAAGLKHVLVNGDALVNLSSDQDVLIVEGEIKNYFLLDQIDQGLFPDFFPVPVAPTGGMGSFLGQDDQGLVYGDVWAPRFRLARRVIMLYDYGLEARAKAIQTARRFFGRRGFVALLEDKVDDLIRSRGDEGRFRVIEAIEAARPAR